MASGSKRVKPRTLAVGVVGIGRIGRQHALNALHNVNRTELLCACSPAPQDLEWADEHLIPYGVNVYKTFEEMVAEPGLEAIIIASTTKFHHDQVQECIKRGLHVLCEKPLSMTVPEARDIVELSQKKENAHLKHLLPPYIMANPGIFIDTGVHDIDLTFAFMGNGLRPKSCHAIGNISRHHKLAEIADVDNATGCVEWYPPSPGAVAPISYYFFSRIMHHGFDNPTEIIGTEGALKVNLHPHRDLITAGDKNGVGNDVMPDFYERYEKAFLTELRVFAEAVLDSKPLPYELDVAVKGMEIASALQQSLRTGKKIEWDENGNLKSTLKSHI
ncbi:hypothetical protein INS49_001077 [Diaporthe citri]|uniref:uncharacterized protein n=1 Tax=Diaporthe citri TaxID=83186 RepID=UPI001C80FFD8|nr:uncharacterized protein INS49_001077 [Diaporthe citri]KAG6366896.1 hypothetical protein INS49_001077 [Diaporthe citri]